MQRFFEIAIMITVMITFINGGFVAFGGPIFDSGIATADGNSFDYNESIVPIYDIRLDPEDINIIATSSANNVKEGDALQQIGSYISQAIGTVTAPLGAIGTIIQQLFAFSTAYQNILFWIFGDMPRLWNFLSWTIIPFINLMQVISLTWIIVYAISAVRGGSAN